MKVKGARKSRVLAREQLKTRCMEIRLKRRQVKSGGRKLKSWEDLVWMGDQIAEGPSAIADLDSTEVKSCKASAVVVMSVLKGTHSREDNVWV